MLDNGYSFPSGHSAGIVVFAGDSWLFCVALLAEHTCQELGIGVGLGVLVGVVGFDRVYLNTHWFSDVLGSLLLGAFWLLFVILLLSMA